MIESYRTRARKLAAAAATLKRQCDQKAPFSLAYLSDQTREPHPERIIRVLPRGAAFILRDYKVAGRLGLARRLAALCRMHQVLFVVGGDAELAAAVRADGFHRPQWASEKSVSMAQSAGCFVTAACHHREELDRAAAFGADLVFLSPVFATQSHVRATSLGPGGFHALAAQSSLPVLALGGIDETNAHKIAAAQVAGFGAIGAFLPKRF